jgi:drug/metabolite transporter (DMT)-like permease
LILAQGTMIWGVRLLPAGVAAVLASSSPLFVALFGWALFRERLSPRQLIGVFAGFAGVGLLAATEARSGGFNVLGAAAMLMGAMAWAVGSLYERRTQLPDSTIVLLATQMLTAGVLLIPVTLVTGELAAWHATRVGPSAWTALAYLVVGGSLVAIGLFTWLNRTISSVVANSFNYVSPLVAMGLAAMLLGERLTVMKLASAGIALFGVALMVTTPKTKVAP